MSCEQETRSVSPQCPKPDESEEPIETASANEVASVTPENESPGAIITKEMEEEEKQLMEEGEKREKEMLEEAQGMWERDTHEMRFKRLQHLLEKSNIYSKFLLTKMEQQQLQETRKKEKLEKKAKLTLKTEASDKGVKRKRRDEEYKIADVMSREEILSTVKKAKVEEEEQGTSRPLDVADIEKISDSNDHIKDRLSQAMRDGSGHQFHPDRVIDGQPVPLQQPRLFTGGVMRWYQIEGIEWLRMLWENGINGILADEMGLGKTIQCIAHIAMMIDRKVTGPFLVVAPLSTLPNWISEFKRFSPEVPVQLYHGHHAERSKLLKTFRRPQGPLNMCPVVVTSFEMAMIDRKTLQRFHWKYLILDEGHRIKNLNCRLVRELKCLPADNKLLLTGTPLQNNLSELWSLLNFLLPEVFDDLKSFESWFDIDTIRQEAENVLGNEREQNVLSMLHQILTPFLLRRLKSDVALEVPPKKEIIVYAPLVGKQAAFYRAAVTKTLSRMLGQEKVEAPLPVEVTSSGRLRRRSRRPVDYVEAEEESPCELEKYLERVRQEHEQRSTPVVDIQGPADSLIHLKLQNMLMLLKRCCNHPYLVEYPLDPVTQDFKIDEQLVQNSGKFLILDRLLPALKKRGHKVLIFSQMTSILDLLMDYCYLRDYEYSRLDGSMAYADREQNMSRFSTDPDVFLFLLSTRAGGLGINLTAADTVIIFDSDWNPQADLQAQDRCHRIGQTKPVVVYRLVTADSIDRAILERATAKRKLEQMVIHKNKFKGGTADLNQKQRIDLNDLMDMLKGGGTEKQVKGTKGKVISDRDLETLLDRSDLMDKDKRKVTKEKVGVFRVIEESSEISLT